MRVLWYHSEKSSIAVLSPPVPVGTLLQSVQTPLLEWHLSPSRVEYSTVRDHPSRKQRNAIANSQMHDPERTGDYHPGGNDEPAAPAVPAAQPQHVGRYRVEKVLGQGGFGVVYLAHDDQLQRLVAIKVPHRTLVDRPDAADAYLAEARTVANLDHPHIVPVFDVGCTEAFLCYVVSKYIDGTDLATRLNQSRLAPHEAVELVATMAEALHHAHKQGLVHRDIKQWG
jgi:eukaryotic-like serine/threonine-protein kinase